MARNLILISGYYGFDNLGDEAILEQLICEVRSVTGNTDEIVVLSNDPQATSSTFGVRSVDRWKVLALPPLMTQTRLFISGGGGLFQATESIKSIIYYGSLIAVARMLGADTLIYAQGLGPLKTKLSQNLTKQALGFAQYMTVRDDSSQSLLESWQLQSQRTADPVWALKASPLPPAVQQALDQARTGPVEQLVGLSLRTGGGFSQTHLQKLVEALNQSLSKNTAIVLLPLQNEQDKPILADFAQMWQKCGRGSVELPLELMTLPSQWLSLMSCLDFVVGMRLHSLIMALASGKAVIGIAYDAKVETVLKQFEQTNLAFTRDSEKAEECSQWAEKVANVVTNQQKFAAIAAKMAAQSRELACQNGALIAKILASK